MKSLLAALLFLGSFAHADDLNCLTEAERAQFNLYANLQQQAYTALDERLQRNESLDTPEQIKEYQAKLRAFLIEQLGGFPERSPLNGQTIGTIEMDGYKIEKVIFDSVPHHHITANLYLPDAEQPVPGVVVSSGHSRTAKTADYNQRFGIMMAKHGMAALCFDPIGQGERSQILDDKGQNKFGGTTTEHFLIGVGSTLVGRNTARYRIWDAMRAIDYISSRPEVDGSKIGFTGCSGGGTLTSYTMALDPRVTCAAPACYLTTFRRLIETIGPQDAEQNIFGQIAFGVDQPDYVIMRAPKPTIISSTTDDFFNIHGSWLTLRESKRIYGKLGYPERVDLVEMPGKHGVQPENLATIAQWMRRWLVGIDEPVDAVVLDVLPGEQLQCTKTGQVLTAFEGEKSVFDLNAEFDKELAPKRQAAWAKASKEERLATVREKLCVEESVSKTPTWRDIGRVDREGYHIDKLVLNSPSGIPLPALTFHPPDADETAYLYLHDSGKECDEDSMKYIEDLVKQGHVVVTVDLRGQGETGSGQLDALLTDWKTYYMAYLLGEPLLGLRVEDALTATDFVAFYQRDEDNPREVHLIGDGQAGLVALHAAALRTERFATVVVHDTPAMWSDVVQQTVPVKQLDSAVHGVLEAYDLPDLVELIGHDKMHRKHP